MTEIETIAIGDMKVCVSGTGSPLILLHGFTTTGEFGREQVNELSRSYQVIRPNLPGHGISRAPANRPYTVEAFVADLEGLLAVLQAIEPTTPAFSGLPDNSAKWPVIS